MDEQLLREVAEEYLVPLFSGAQLTAVADHKNTGQLVAWRDPLSIAFKVNRSDKYRLILTRAQRFAKSKEVTLPETAVVQAFVEVVGSMEAALATTLKHDLLSTFQRRVVARSIGGRDHEMLFLAGIDQLAHWGARLYEGAPISASIGFRNMKGEFEIPMAELASHDFAAVMSNGYDTILEFDFKNNFVGHRQLKDGDHIPSYCPLRQAPIAEWTTVHEARVALTLNRLGEVLIFRNQELLFARRSGRWNFLTHGPVIKQMGIPRSLELRTAIYETCLDASFARTGACIGVVNQSEEAKWKEIVVHEADQLAANSSTKAKVLNAILGGKKFQNLDRRLRQELSAIDGAVVLSHEGVVLSIGAILKIPGGSSGGGRLAAARALSKLGLGIKVSQDGGITGYRKGGTKPSFKVM